MNKQKIKISLFLSIYCMILTFSSYSAESANLKSNQVDQSTTKLTFGIWEINKLSFFYPINLKTSRGASISVDTLNSDSIVLATDGKPSSERNIKISDIEDIQSGFFNKAVGKCENGAVFYRKNAKLATKLDTCSDPQNLIYLSLDNNFIAIDSIDGVLYEPLSKQIDDRKKLKKLAPNSGGQSSFQSDTGYRSKIVSLDLRGNIGSIGAIFFHTDPEEIIVLNRLIKRANEIANVQLEQESIQKANLEKQYNEAIVYRENLKTGDQTQCGLVIEVRKPIAKIQLGNIEKWVKVDDLFPQGSTNCKL